MAQSKNREEHDSMAIGEQIKKIFAYFGLEQREYELIRYRIVEDNRRKLSSASLILAFFLFVMFVMSFFVVSFSHARNTYIATFVLMLFHVILAKVGKKRTDLVSPAVYFFMSVAFGYGMWQGLVTAPAEQTASFVVLMVAVPVWFTMKPSIMIRFIYVHALIYIGFVLWIKTGYVQTADIVNTVIYSSASALISTYYTIVKAKRFYAEYCTERMGKTDMLTGLGNRHACQETIDKYEKKSLPGNLTVIYLDVNELKHINDTLGHHVGDELIRGAAECISTVFSQVGECYRTGGDEFVVIGEFSDALRRELYHQFERVMEEWTGSQGHKLRVSYGGASARELPDGDIMQISKLADSRLYESKALYYSTKGIDRCEQQKAYRAMCESYIRIFRVDLERDICKVIHAEAIDDLVTVGESGSFSRWVNKLSDSGWIHPDDVEEFLEKLNTEYLREYFRSGKSTIHIFYRRKVGEMFYSVMTEFATSPEYSEDQQIVYLYVKNIDRLN